MYKLYCRVFQFIMKIANYFVGYKQVDTLVGQNKITQLPKLIKSKGFDNVLIVTDPSLIKLHLLDSLTASLNKSKIKYTIFSNVDSNPTDINVYEGYQVFKQEKCQAIIAFGGGSPIDAAKAIAAINACPNKTISQLQGVLKVHKKVVDIWAVPTTAGTGSETTIASVITEKETHHKASINDPSIMPKYAILDPNLTIGLPASITAMTGMDALCHAIESYTNSTYCTQLENDLAKKAVRLIYDNLYIAYLDGSNIKARENMQLAAFYAGRSFTRGCVGYVHAVGHTLSGLYNVAHGKAMAIILPHVLRQYSDSCIDKLAELASVCQIEGTNKQKAESFIEWIEDLKDKMNIPKYVDCILDEDVDQIIKWAIKEANPLYPTPQVWEYKDFDKLIKTIRGLM